jgi:hypothetical protein
MQKDWLTIDRLPILWHNLSQHLATRKAMMETSKPERAVSEPGMGVSQVSATG